MSPQDSPRKGSGSAARAQPSAGHTLLQMRLFAEQGGRIKKLHKKERSPRPKGLQYKLKLNVRKTDRKIAYRPHTTEHEDSNLEHWDHTWVVRLHSVLLRESLDAIKAHCEKGSPRAAEIMAWVERNGTNEPFSFETCCEVFCDESDDDTIVGPIDPEVLRHQLRALIRRTFGTDLPHATVLKRGILEAESGNLDARQWVMSESDGPLSFNDCCAAIGYEPVDARKEIALPPPAADDLESFIDAAFERYVFSRAA